MRSTLQANAKMVLHHSRPKRMYIYGPYITGIHEAPPQLVDLYLGRLTSRGKGGTDKPASSSSDAKPSASAAWLRQTLRDFPCKHLSRLSVSAHETCAAEPRSIKSIIGNKRRRYISKLLVACHLIALLCRGVLRTESLACVRSLPPLCTGCGSLRGSSGRGSVQALDGALAGVGLKIIFSERGTEAAEKVGRAKS